MALRDRLAPVVVAVAVGTVALLSIGVMPVLGATYEPVNETGTINDTDHFAWVGTTPCGSTHANIRFEYFATAGFQGVAAWEFQANHPPGVVVGSTGGQWVTYSAGNVPRLQVIVPTWQAQSAAFHVYRTSQTGTFSIRNVRVWISYEDDAPECAPSGGAPTPTPRPRPTATPSAGPAPTPVPTATPFGNPTPPPGGTPTPPPEWCENEDWNPEVPGTGPLVPCEEEEPPSTDPNDSVCAGFPSQANSPSTGRVHDTTPVYGFENGDTWLVELCIRTNTMTVGTFGDGSPGDTVQWSQIGYLATGHDVGGAGVIGYTVGDTSPGSMAGWGDNTGWKYRQTIASFDATTAYGGNLACGGWSYAGSGGATVYCAGRAFQLVDGDPDEDGYGNDQENAASTDPNDPDSHPTGPADGPDDDDGDGYSNEVEAGAGTDPGDPDSYPGSEEPEGPPATECGLPGVDDPCVDYPGMGQGGGIYPNGGLGTAFAEECVPEYPKAGQLPLVTWVPPVAPDGWEPWEWIAYTAANVAHLPDAFVNLFRGFWNLIVDFLVPSNCLQVAFEGFLEDMQEEPPFNIFVWGNELVSTALSGGAGSLDVPTLNIMGAEIEVDSGIENAISAVAPYRGLLAAGVYLMVVLWAIRLVMSLWGIRGGGSSGSE